jgi:hypothetical protein
MTDLNMYEQSDIAKALELAYGVVRRAADLLGCSPQTIYNWLARDDELRTLRDELRSRLVDLGEHGLLEHLEAGQWKAIRFVLETLGKHRGYGRRQDDQRFGGPIYVEMVNYADQVAAGDDQLASGNVVKA